MSLEKPDYFPTKFEFEINQDCKNNKRIYKTRQKPDFFPTKFETENN